MEWIAFHAAPPEHRSAISYTLLVSPPTTCQHYSFESMENLSEHREICQHLELAWLSASPWPLFASRDAESTDGAALARGVANRK